MPGQRHRRHHRRPAGAADDDARAEPERTLPPDPTTPDTVAPGTPLPSGVEAQQAKLNELFANKGLLAAHRRRAVGPA